MINFFKDIKNIYLRYRQFIQDFLNYKLGYFINKIFSWILLIILTHILSKELIGIYSIITNFAFLISPILSLGIPNLIFKKEISEKEIPFLFCVQFIFSFFFIFILIILSPFISTILLKTNSLWYLIILAIFLAFVSSLYNLLISFLLFKMRFKEIRNIFIYEGFFKLNIISFLSLFFNIIGTILGFILTYFLLIFILLNDLLLFYYQSIIKNINKIKYILRSKIYLLKKTILSLLYSFSSISFEFIDLLILSILLSFSDIASYKIACSIFGVLYILRSINLLLYPRFKKYNYKDSINILKKGILFQFSISTLIFVCYLLIGRYIILILFGNSYLDVYDILKILLLIFFTDYQLLLSYIFVIQDIKKIILFNISIALTNAILDVILVKFYGVYGAAYASVISSFIGFIILLSFLLYKYKYYGSKNYI